MAVANRRMLPLLLLSGDEDEKKKVLKQSAKESVFSPKSLFGFDTTTLKQSAKESVFSPL